MRMTITSILKDKKAARDLRYMIQHLFTFNLDFNGRLAFVIGGLLAAGASRSASHLALYLRTPQFNSESSRISEGCTVSILH